MDLKRGIDLATRAVVAGIEAASKPVSTNAEIAQIATISANNDAAIGDMIAKAMAAVGSAGAIPVFSCEVWLRRHTGKNVQPWPKKRVILFALISIPIWPT